MAPLESSSTDAGDTTYSNCTSKQKSIASDRMTIGELGRRTETRAGAIRHYERIGLLPPPTRTGSNRRLYAAADVTRLMFIRQARRLGFSLEAVRDLLALAENPERDCADADASASRHLADIRDRIARLQALERELTAMVGGPCAGTAENCSVVRALAGVDS